MKSPKTLLLVLFATVLAFIAMTEVGSGFLLSIIEFLGRKGVAVIVTPIIGGIFALLSLKFKSGVDIIKNEVKSVIEKLEDKLSLTNEKIDNLKTEWEDIKQTRAVKFAYKKSLNNISNNLIICFKIDYNLKKFASVISETIIDFSSDIQKYDDLSEIDFDIITQKLTVITEMIRQTGYGFIDREFVDSYFAMIFLPDLENFKNKIKYIIDDKLNDKCNRFHQEVSRLLKNILSEMLTLWLDSKTK